MEMNYSVAVDITDETSVGEARRVSRIAADRVGFDETRSGEFALMATEVARNVLRHGAGGQTVIRIEKRSGAPVGSILALDKGPGFKDVTRAFEDGYSTGGTLGLGMSALKRAATTFDLFTANTGSVVYLELSEAKNSDGVQVSGVAVPFPGERHCGDAWSYSSSPGRMTVQLVDGLGHGHHAAEAAEEAVRTFQKHSHRSPGEIVRLLHDALKKTRGAAAAVAEIDFRTGQLTYAGIGNIAAVILSKSISRSLISHNGTLGAIISRIQEFKCDWPNDAILIMHSDGIHSRWDLSGYAGLMSRHAAVIGGILLRDFRRTRDDASVLVVKGTR